MVGKLPRPLKPPSYAFSCHTKPKSMTIVMFSCQNKQTDSSIDTVIICPDGNKLSVFLLKITHFLHMRKKQTWSSGYYVDQVEKL